MQEIRRNTLCGGYRKVNSITEFDAELLSDQKVIFSSLSSSRFFTKLDLLKGFFQILLHPDICKVTATETLIGLYQHRALPFTSIELFHLDLLQVLRCLRG